jgi:hypothetical protein
MTPEDDEARLRAALAEAHRHDGGGRLLSSASGRPLAGRRASAGRGLAVSAALATAVVALWTLWLVARPQLLPTWQPRGTRWIAPTDFLLETPDLITLRTLPGLDPSADPLLRSPPAPPRGVP